MSVAKYHLLKNIAENKNLIRKILDVSADGLMVVNREGIIVYVNQSFVDIHNIPEKEAVGRHVTKIIENTRMHFVAETGMAETDAIQTIHGRDVVVSRIPLIEDDECIGAVGKIRFLDVGEVKDLTERVNKIEKQLRKTPLKNTDTHYTFADIVAFSASSLNAKKSAYRSATCDASVLLLGESGVGKEVYAHSIHNLSKRNKGPFIRLNCSAIQQELFESELFGYEEGAFTGAKKGGRKGKFEQAHTGTIFLDEIGDMPLNAQAKLLRVLQEKEIDKLGGEKIVHIDVRVIAATNQNLEQLVEEGKFRKDLFYRLNVIPIILPPLRERELDIPELIRLFWKQLKKDHGIYYKQLDHSALMVMQKYEWPGNIRELRNILERAMTVVLQDTVTAEHIQTIIMGQRGMGDDNCTQNECELTKLVENTEKKAISIALVRANNNRSQAAKILGISRALLYKKMHYYKLII